MFMMIVIKTIFGFVLYQYSKSCSVLGKVNFYMASVKVTPSLFNAKVVYTE